MYRAAGRWAVGMVIDRAKGGWTAMRLLFVFFYDLRTIKCSIFALEKREINPIMRQEYIV